MIRTIIFSLLFLILFQTPIFAKGKGEVVFTPNMTFRIDKSGRLIFYPFNMRLAAGTTEVSAMYGSKEEDGGINSKVLIKAFELFIDDVAKQMCGFKYKPESFELSVPGVATAKWNTEDICADKGPSSRSGSR